jgi:hypothetical protein
MFEAPAIIGTCINCIAPGSLSATLVFVLIGAGVALTAERRKLVLQAKTQAAPTNPTDRKRCCGCSDGH